MDQNAVNRLPALDTGQVLELFEVTAAGLSAEEADRRRRIYGRNALPKPALVPLWRLLCNQLVHFMALLLWAAGAMAFFIDMPELGVATWSIVLINALFSFWQEYKAEQALSKLADLLPRKAKVFRQGRIEFVQAESLVPGDVLFIEAGDHIPADARLIEAEDLSVDISLLTGESLPVERVDTPTETGRPPSQSENLILAGTTATAGQGVAVIYAIGRQTELGKVAKLTATVEREKSTLELQVQHIVRLITTIAVLMGGAVFLLAIWWMGIGVRESLIFAIGIIVANVPEGLLPTVSLSLAVGVQRMAGQNALVRRLSAVEAICATSVICTDKTGTLTLNKMTVKKIWVPGGDAWVEGAGYDKAGIIHFSAPAIEAQVSLLLTIGTVCSESNLVEDPEHIGTWKIIGDPTEAALLVAAVKVGQKIESIRDGFRRQQVIPFSSERRMMTTIDVNLSSPWFERGQTITMVKGSPLELLRKCSFQLQAGQVIALSDVDRQEIATKNDDMAREGHRVLALAYRNMDVLEPPEQQLIFVGLVGMIDPPRPEVSEAMELCRLAGIRVTMITGDYGVTAEAIARQINLVKDRVAVVTGTEVDAMPEAQLHKLLSQEIPLLFSRVNPEHKLRIVEGYKALGEIVAVTGDGVNDAPALKSAHVGIAMGRGGTDVAREVADIVLLDDHFATIIKAIEQGRAIYDNIRKFMTYVLASNIPEIVPYLAMVFARIPPALNILQILAIDIGTDMLPAMALGAEHPEQGVMKRKPSDYRQNLLDRSLLLRSYSFLGIVEAILSLGAFFMVWESYGYKFSDIQGLTASILSNSADKSVTYMYQHSTSMALATIVACQVGNLFVCRSDRLTFWQMSLWENKLFLAGVASEISVLTLILYWPFLTAVFMTTPLTLDDLKLLLLCPFIMIGAEEVRRFLAKSIPWAHII